MNPEKSHKHRLLVILPGVFISLGLWATMFLIVIGGIIDSTDKLKPVTFDNGAGSTYGLNFYEQYRFSDINIVDTGTKGNVANPNSPKKELVSQISHGGKSPLIIRIGGVSGGTAAQAASYEKSKTCSSSAPAALVVHNTALNQDINLCNLNASNGVDLMYVGVFKDHGKTNVFMIRQDINFATAKDGSSARQVLAQTGLQEYRADIENIMSSVHLAN